MAENKFKRYLMDGQPFGDIVDLPFVDDAVLDQNLPDAKSWEELEHYIKQRNPDVSPDTLDAAKHVWELYLPSLE